MSFSLSIDEAKELLPNYNIVDSLPSSGQKAAFICEDNGKLYALKIYDPESSIDRVQREIRAMTLVESQNVVKFEEFHLSVSRKRTITYSLEEYIKGEDLCTVLKKGRRFSDKGLIEFLTSILQGLCEIKKYNIVHRDIKPGNIMIREDGTPVIIDFGIARHLDLSALTDLNMPIGPCTYPYASPEQLSNSVNNIDCRCDLYALGIVAYESYTGEHPYWVYSDNPQNNINRMMKSDIPMLPTENRELQMFVKKLMTRELHRRFRTPEIALEYLTEIGGE